MNIEKEELVRRLKIAEPYNNQDVPQYIWDIINGMPSSAERKGKWKVICAETDYCNGWIEFSCECCEYQHGLESGEYDWHYGDEIPWKYCPICGARMVSEALDRKKDDNDFCSDVERRTE